MTPKELFGAILLLIIIIIVWNDFLRLAKAKNQPHSGLNTLAFDLYFPVGITWLLL